MPEKQHWLGIKQTDREQSKQVEVIKAQKILTTEIQEVQVAVSEASGDAPIASAQTHIQRQAVLTVSDISAEELMQYEKPPAIDAVVGGKRRHKYTKTIKRRKYVR